MISLECSLYKGNGKPKTEPNSYRPFSLLPYMLEVFEHIIKSRLTNHVLDSKDFPNKQHQGFQRYLDCINASFNLHETIYHNIERLSNAFVGFLDRDRI